MSNSKYFDGNKFVELGKDTIESLGITAENIGVSKQYIEDLGINKASMGLDKVDNFKQMPITGGTFQGLAKAQNNNSYTTAQLRNVILSSGDANLSSMQDGDIWIKYE